MKQHGHRTRSADFGDERLLVFSEKLRDGRKSIHEDAGHLISLKIASSKDKRRDTGLHERRSFKIPVSDAMVFGEHHPALLPDVG